MDKLQNAFILHLRSYTDSRVLLEVFTRESGRQVMVARAPGKRNRTLYQPFQSVLLSWRGTNDLKALVTCELSEELRCTFSGRVLFCGIYVNELLLRALPSGDPHEALFDLYTHCLSRLNAVTCLSSAEPVLRDFEFQLLRECGYCLDFYTCAQSGQSIIAGSYYRLERDVGFVLISDNDADRQGCFWGNDLVAIREGRYDADGVKISAKRITRSALLPLLGGRPLKSRELFT